jgi:predicted DNA-binding protein (MmcQ/YjbR family)
MTGDDFRDIALGMQGAIERAHMGHPDFRANGRIFATLMADEQSGGLNLTPDDQAELMRMHPKTFTPASGAWGRQGWTMVHLDGADQAAVRGALLLAWQLVVERFPRARASKPSTSTSSMPRTARAPRQRRQLRTSKKKP